MGAHVASEVVKLMLKSGKPVKDNKALMLGITFKENCPDIRNTRAIDIYHELKSYGMDVDIFDPWANPAEVKREYGIDILTEYPVTKSRSPSVHLSPIYGAIILAVSHNEFIDIDTIDDFNLATKIILE